jgi:hypothetical protein
VLLDPLLPVVPLLELLVDPLLGAPPLPVLLGAPPLPVLLAPPLPLLLPPLLVPLPPEHAAAAPYAETRTERQAMRVARAVLNFRIRRK